MTTLIDFALMAGASYISTRDTINRIPPPAGWVESVSDRTTKSSGFEATFFTRGNEIVISFAGTYPTDFTGDWIANVALATGNICDQLRQAADYYLAVRAANPGATITLTGHSLGGGLAALIAVMFGETAYTFDQAPFLNSALTVAARDELGNVIEVHSVAQDLRDYLAGRATPDLLSKLDAYINANDPRNITPIVADTLSTRSQNVSNTRLDGEFISSWFPINLFSNIGLPPVTLTHGTTSVIGSDLHSQTLLTAFLQSEKTATVNAATGVKESLGQIAKGVSFALVMEPSCHVAHALD